MRALKCSATVETVYGPWRGGCLGFWPEEAGQWGDAVTTFSKLLDRAMGEMPSDDVLSVVVDMCGTRIGVQEHLAWQAEAIDVNGVLWGQLTLVFYPIILKTKGRKHGS